MRVLIKSMDYSPAPVPSRPRRDGPRCVGGARPRGVADLGRVLALLVLSSLVGSPATAGDEPATYGPLYHEFALTLEPGERAEAVGPVLSAEVRPSWVNWALSPFLSYSRNTELDSLEFDILYPFVTYDRFGGEYKLRFSLLTTFTGWTGQQGDLQRRLTLFPLYFQQKSPRPELRYRALFPIHGTLQDRLNRDRIDFTLFPLYLRTEKRDMVTANYLYPVVHVRRGDSLTGWQVLPFAGQERREPFLRTNNFGGVDLVPGHDKSFVLWPFYSRQRLGLGTTNPENHDIYFPLYAQSRSPARDATTWLWPFVNVIDDRAKGYREWQVPFPVVMFARGPGKTMDRVLPLYSRVRTAQSESGFLLWPLYRYKAVTLPPLARQRDRVLFFLYSNVRETNTFRGTVLRRLDVWPLFTARRDHEGCERFQALAVLEPFLPNNKAVERNYSPVWSVWRSERNPATGAASASLLWNLYRHEQTPETRKTSLCFGLFQYQSTPAGRRVRVFFIPVTRSKPAAPGD